VKPGLGGCRRHQSPNYAFRSEVWLNPAMAFGAECRRLKEVINSYEEILKAKKTPAYLFMAQYQFRNN
jgi:hypothetical protein